MLAMDLFYRVVTHPLARLGWLVTVLVLAACNNGNSGNPGGGY